MLEQPSLLDWSPKGPFITPADEKRLGKQMQAVLDYMSDGKWHTLRQIADDLGYPEASISARLRDLKNQLHKQTERKNMGGGLWMYRMVIA